MQEERAAPGKTCQCASRLCLTIAILLAIPTTYCAAEDQPPAAPEKNAPLSPDTIVAWVNATPISFRDVEYGTGVLAVGRKIDPGQLPTLQATALEEMIEQILLSRFFESADSQPTTEEIDSAMEAFRKRLKEQKTNLKDYLDKNKMTEAALRKKVTQDAALNKYVAQNTNDKNLEAFFNHHRAQFDGSQRRASHILLRPTGIIDDSNMRSLIARADELRNRISTGELTFEAAAEKYSFGPSRAMGGDLGFFVRQGNMTEAFSEAAFALNPNEISRPVVDMFGVHLIKVTEIKEGQKTWQNAGEPLTTAYNRFVLDQLIAKLRKKAKIDFKTNFPHFIPGTRQLAPQTVGTKP